MSSTLLLLHANVQAPCKRPGNLIPPCPPPAKTSAHKGERKEHLPITHLAKANDGDGLASQRCTDVGVPVPLALLHGGISLGHVPGHGAQHGDAVLCCGDGVGCGGVNNQAAAL